VPDCSDDDTLSYNDNNEENAHIPTSFDFTEDLAELEQPVEYPGLKVSWFLEFS